MKRKIRNLGIAVTILGIAILLVQCGKKDSTSYSKLTGTVKLQDSTVANGAIVVLSTKANAADIIARTVADSNGAYSFMGIQDGDYFLSATYEPSNNNNVLKSASTVILTGPEKQVTVSGDTKANFVIQSMVPSGNAVIDISSGWTYDETHSMTEFEFPFDAVDARFSGHFARTGLDVFHFDEANPSNTKIYAWVDLTSAETGAATVPGGHGRDGLMGCITGTLGVNTNPADTITAYAPDGTTVTNWLNDKLVTDNLDIYGDGTSTSYERQSAVVGTSGVAAFKSTSVTAYGTGYAAKGDLTFDGVTKSVTLYFNYLEGYSSTSGTTTVDYCSFYGFFKIAAAADFGVDSHHIGNNDVTVKLSIQLNKSTTN